MRGNRYKRGRLMRVYQGEFVKKSPVYGFLLELKDDILDGIESGTSQDKIRREIKRFFGVEVSAWEFQRFCREFFN